MQADNKRPTKQVSSSLSITPYITGFVLALILTISAYVLVVNHLLDTVSLTGAVIFLAVLQLVVQLYFFLHVGKKGSALWHNAAFYFMLIILVIIVGGSLWIMSHLNYNMMSPHEMNDYMLDQNHKGF